MDVPGIEQRRALPSGPLETYLDCRRAARVKKYIILYYIILYYIILLYICNYFLWPLETLLDCRRAARVKMVIIALSLYETTFCIVEMHARARAH